MTCTSCNEKFPTKHANRCLQLSSRICLKCAIEGSGSHACDLDCAGGRFPALKVYPLSNSVVGMSPTGEVRGTTEEFVPRGFHFLSCNVKDIKIAMKRINLLEVEVAFSLKGNESILESIYSREGWKLLHLENLLKNANTKINYPMGPTFTTFTHPGLRVIPESVNLTIDGRPGLALINDTAEVIGLPDCFPPLTESPKPSTEKHSFFWAKSSVFYTPLVLEKEYKISYKIEAISFYYELGFLFPFRFVQYGNIRIDSETSFDLAGRKMRYMIPFRADKFPPRQEYEWHRTHKTNDLLPPSIVRADPFRIQPMKGDSVTPQKDIKSSEYLSAKKEDYSALQILFLIKKPKDKDLISIVETTESPIPIRIYEQLQKLPKYRDFLISFDLFNISEKPIDLELKSQIKGYTDVAIDNITLPPYGPTTSKHVLIPQIPKLKRGILSKISTASEATLEYSITKKNNNKRIVIERGAHVIKFLPQDMIVWAIKDPKSSNLYDLSKMLGAWITPSDPRGSLDKTRAGAAAFHPSGALEGEQGDTTLQEKTLQVKALYEYLNEEVKMKYVNQPFSFDFNAGGQRVLTPERVLSIKAGNCIDLVILFASLMEGLGITPYILIMPGHAFLGWGNKYKTSEMGFLECTLLGSTDKTTGKKFTFDKAFEIAEKTFKEKFLYIGSEDYLPLRSITLGGERGFIVDLKEIRKEGIFRMS